MIEWNKRFHALVEIMNCGCVMRQDLFTALSLYIYFGLSRFRLYGVHHISSQHQMDICMTPKAVICVCIMVFLTSRFQKLRKRHLQTASFLKNLWQGERKI